MLLVERGGNYHYQLANALYFDEALSCFAAQNIENNHKTKTNLTGGLLVGTLLSSLSSAFIGNILDENILMNLCGVLSVSAFISLVAYITHENIKKKEIEEQTSNTQDIIKSFLEKFGYEPIIIGSDAGLDIINVPDHYFKMSHFVSTSMGDVLANESIKMILDLRARVIKYDGDSTKDDLLKLESVLVESLHTGDLSVRQLDIIGDIESRTLSKSR